jgi:uncharacterized membrane protein SpoIIM required for sporulation
MREAQFQKQNGTTWKEFEKNFRSGRRVNPDELAEQYIRLTDDLSFARTFYPESKVTRYLNELAAQVHIRIYKNKRERRGRFAAFWKYEAPEAAYRLRKPFLYSFLTFSIAILIGIISVERDDAFVRLILGDGYVNMTMENIKNGDPMGVYKDHAPVLMFLHIAINNIYVALFAFASGILLSAFTGYILFRNGVMLGVFQWFFHRYGLMGETALTIWIHGTLEISAIVLAGGAGLQLGGSLLFPGTYSRLYSLRTAAMDGLKIIVSLMPVFITAAFLESFVTRHTEMPLWLSLFIILSSLAFIIFYYGYYPYRLHKKTLNETGNERPA